MEDNEKYYTAKINLELTIIGQTEEQAHKLTRDFIDWLYYWSDYQYYYDTGDNEEGLPALRYIKTELAEIVGDD